MRSFLPLGAACFAVAAMERAGFEIQDPGGENPHYRVTHSEDAPPQECFPKKYDERARQIATEMFYLLCQARAYPTV